MIVTPPLYPPGSQSTFGTDSIQSCGLDHYNMNSAALASAIWPTANMAIYMPMRVVSPVTVDRIGLWNGTVVSGNFDVGIFDGVSKVKLGSTGATAHTGTSVTQQAALTATLVLPRGFYFVGIAFDNITARLFRRTLGFIHLNTCAGFRSELSAYPLPATATMVVPSTTYIPMYTIYTVEQ